MIDERLNLIEDDDPKLPGDFGLAFAVQQHLDKAASELPSDLASWIKLRFDECLDMGPWDTLWNELAPQYRLEAAKRCDEIFKFEILKKRFASEKTAAGRYTLAEAARLLASSGERLAVVVQMLCDAAERSELPVYSWGERVRFVQTAGDSPSWRSKEAYWDDLNHWLTKHQPRIAYSFSPPKKTALAPSKSHQLRNRRHALDHVIEVAVSRATDPTNYLSVWPELVRLAEMGEPPAPLLGYVDAEGIKYQVDAGIKFFTKNALRKRMAA
ncbi:hypothetical protein [Paraburkholderia acidisoli]|uniref:Uncharacterized protein n=1 Tax=Paraburkholderia acidisoli TaxID=2571748 RepID=A0A7Z2GFY6_9BURK|nr:hypothetical protein [Paraburkholderia acidisoli]QGZ61081.1 hypothetical protein FAZ98_04660 [Paraburkholderia acidisoli]